MTPAESAIVQAGFPEADGPMIPVRQAATAAEAAIAAIPEAKAASTIQKCSTITNSI